MSGIALDAGGLIAIDGGDRRVLILVERARQRGLRISVPATALAQVIRLPAKQARLARLVRDPRTDVIPLDARHATAVGLMLARTGTADIVDAHVAICARAAGQAVVTSDPKDLARLDPDLSLVIV